MYRIVYWQSYVVEYWGLRSGNCQTDSFDVGILVHWFVVCFGLVFMAAFHCVVIWNH